ncbi:helix-turn-helix domain-containing protein [Candidatus Acetothermia bacterium]|nr:helix-turn-helix domain-containing protein [Candidatus Acetothermia bacterium]
MSQQEIPGNQRNQTWINKQPSTEKSTDKMDFQALEDSAWVYVKNVANYLEISTHQARRLMKKGAIISEKPAGAWRARKKDVLAYQQSVRRPRPD